MIQSIFRKLAVSVLLTVLFLITCMKAQQVEIHAPYVETLPHVVDAMLKLAKLKKSDVIYDLGCGDGRIVIAAAKRYGCRGVGIDINPERVRQAEANARREGVAALTAFRTEDVNNADFGEATALTLYLLPDINLGLRPKLRCELKPGTRIVSHSFDMGDWKPKRTQTIENEKIFLWTIPSSFWSALRGRSACSGYL